MTASPRKTTEPSEDRLAQLLAVLEDRATLLAFFFGLCFVAVLLVLAVWFPQPTAFQYTVFRITLALAAAGIAGIIPGMIRLTVKPGTALLIHAGGALAVFVMVYLLAPARLPMETVPPVSGKDDTERLPSPLPLHKEKPNTVPQKSDKKEQAVLEKNLSPASEEISRTAGAAKKKIQIEQYIDNRDGTITDTKTGLMWKRCSEGLSGVNCEEGHVKKYEYYDAVKHFKDVEYAGYTDWRLPTINELKTLVYCSNGKDDEGDCNNGSEKPTIKQQAFPNTSSDWFWYWSGSPVADNSGNAWYVSFSSGFSLASIRNYAYAVRLVRGGQ